MARKYIPNYGLYGETADRFHAGEIHIEEIADRSRGQDWIIKPHRHGKLFQLLCIFDGRAEIQLDENHCQLEGTWLVTVPVGVVHGFRFQPDSRGVVISISEELIGDAGHLHDSDYPHPVFEQAVPIEFKEDDENIAQLTQYIDLLRYEFKGLQSAHYKSLLLLLKLFLIVVKRQYEHNASAGIANQSNRRIPDNFRKLLEHHYKEHWRVSDYAESLNISPSTLNRLCHERFAASAKSLILSRLMAEAKRQMLFTQQSIDEIAYRIGYKDPAYFSRLFKKMEKMTPGEYRRSVQHL